jgi:Tol biopolymer transport system component
VNYEGLTFSRDVNFVYYVRTDKDNPGGALYKAPVLGGQVRKLLVHVSSPISLSPDGKQLAFVRDDPSQNRSQDEYAFMIANEDGSEEKKLSVHKIGTGVFYSGGGPAWSPDGRTIAFGQVHRKGDSDSGGYRNVIGVRVADGVEQPMTSQRWDGPLTPFMRIAWLADSSGVLVTGAEQESLHQIWYLAWPGDEARSLTDGLNGYEDISLTADSSTLSAVESDRVVNLWIAPNGEARSARQITSGAGREDGSRGISWTPDGKIVYHSTAGGNQNIWITEADGAGNKQLLPQALQNQGPAVSPDGRYVVWASWLGALGIWRMDIDGSNPKKLTNRPARSPQVSPDGKWVVYSNPNYILMKIPIDGGDEVRLTDKPAGRAVISTDGKLIACNYQDEANGQFKIAIIPFEGGPPTRVFDLVGRPNRDLQWTPDGRAIAYIVTSNSVSNIWAQPLAGGEPKPLTDFKDQRIFNFAWSRDGKQLALSRGVVNSDVVLITGFKQP